MEHLSVTIVWLIISHSTMLSGSGRVLGHLDKMLQPPLERVTSSDATGVLCFLAIFV